MSYSKIFQSFAHFRPKIHPVVLSIIVAFTIVLFYNGRLWSLVLAGWPGRNFSDYAFFVSLGLVLSVALTLILQLFAFSKVMKPFLVFLFITAAAVSYFSQSYGVIFDKEMIANVMGTDSHEVGDLLSFQLVFTILLYGIVPALIAMRLKLPVYSLGKEAMLRGGVMLAGIAIIGLVAATFFQDYATFVRNNRHIRYSINPTSAIYYTAGYAIDLMTPRVEGIQPVANEVTAGPALSNSDRPAVFVLVIGETARAQNFSLDGYERQTNPELSQLPIINFPNVASCGTSTAESLPCMLSPFTRGEQSKAVMTYSENIVDIATRAGFKVDWIENNSGGCKGTCRPEQMVPLGSLDDGVSCASGGCLDEILIRRLNEKLATLTQNTLFVLHQMGSHGPTYYKRYPPEYRRFTPTCDTNQLQTCTDEQIVNTYDNSILYTDKILADTISALADIEARADVGMIYVSDHGESLGENGIYLHGFPYSFAPEVQKHVPMIMWSSNGFQNRFGLDEACMSAAQNDDLSHDYLFHTIVGVLDIQTDAYRRELDFLSACDKSEIGTTETDAVDEAKPVENVAQ